MLAAWLEVEREREDNVIGNEVACAKRSSADWRCASVGSGGSFCTMARWRSSTTKRVSRLPPGCERPDEPHNCHCISPPPRTWCRPWHSQAEAKVAPRWDLPVSLRPSPLSLSLPGCQPIELQARSRMRATNLDVLTAQWDHTRSPIWRAHSCKVYPKLTQKTTEWRARCALHLFCCIAEQRGRFTNLNRRGRRVMRTHPTDHARCASRHSIRRARSSCAHLLVPGKTRLLIQRYLAPWPQWTYPKK